MGTGDVRSYTNTANGTPINSPVNTPNIDRIANAGMRFTNAHSPSSVCTPTRYALLTGQYPWRGALQTGVVPPYGRSIIAPERLTVGEMLQQQGYKTAAFGKWHLGMNWVTTNGGTPLQNGSNVNHSVPFARGPIEHGFDTFYGIDGSANFPPYAFIRDNQTIGVPTGQVRGNPVSSGNLLGPIVPGFSIADVLPSITNEAASYIRARASEPDPFFVYFPLTAPHEPILPRTDIVPATGTGGYGNFIALVDWSVGRVINALEDPDNNGDTSDSILNDTLLIFTADNGAENSLSFSTSPGYIDGQAMRGDKATVYEGGHRVPFLAQWSGQIAPGSVSDEFVELTDFMGTVADIVGYSLPDNAAEDSFSIASLLLGDATRPARAAGVQRSAAGAYIIRQFDDLGNEWKLIFTSDHGGPGGTAGFHPSATITDFSQLQLYNLTADPREESNLLAGGGTLEMQQLALQLRASLLNAMTVGRSAPSIATGDYNGDRVVDLDDYAFWKAAYGGTNFAADGNGDGRVDAGDYVVWRNHLDSLGHFGGWGSLAGGGGLTWGAVPEPATAVQLALALVYGVCMRRRVSATRRRG